MGTLADKMLALGKPRSNSGGVLACRMLASGGIRNYAMQPDSPRVSFLTHPGFKEFRRVVAGLRERCPAGKPVVIRTAWLPPNLYGECGRRAARFVIRLNDRLGEQEAIETLLHEWAHAIAWNFRLDNLARRPEIDRDEFEQASHDEAWGCAYARVWREYIGDFSAGA